ncbi:hypothetical protein [Prescottella subtropica]|uniref:hypothetical protein n=1 Tax=Prescottella subtropica TaxID=2545757 RepID=UPI001883936F|nr:hypothetical protein [Prescottella subtropica]
MGYTTTFTGEIHVHPPLNEAERAYLHRFSRSRRVDSPLGPYAFDGETAGDDSNRVVGGQPGLWCQWVPSDDGSRLVWNGLEKFYRSSAWMRYLIDTFLCRGALLQHDLTDPKPGWAFPDELRQFAFDHTLHGTILASGQDGATWRIEVRDNEVSVVETSGPAPIEYTLFLLPRHTLHALDREFDAAFDIDEYEDEYADRREIPRIVEACVRELFPSAQCGGASGPHEDDAHLILRDAQSGLSVVVWERDVRIGVLAEQSLPDAERSFGRVQQLAREITKRTAWIAYDPAQRRALRPGEKFRDRAIDLIRGYIEEPDGRWAWNVM